MKYSKEFKLKCIALHSGRTADEVYEIILNDGENIASRGTFKIMLSQWEKKYGRANIDMLESGTFKFFAPDKATVQCNRDGEIVQYWVKQNQDDEIDYESLFKSARELIQSFDKIPREIDISKAEDKMLEIPLFDMHFGINDLFDYREQMNEITKIISKSQATQIFIPIGQDLFHNDDFRGRTTKGTQIEKVDIERAWAYALKFYTTIIDSACRNSIQVHLSFSEGNHDETLGWAFFQCLECLYENQDNMFFDDSRSPRKCFHWGNVFIGYGHCDDGRTSQKDVRMQFTIEFPREFADSQVREIHLGHMHTEITSGDVNGVMVRRLSTANKTDSWHKKNGYVGNHKRFQLFEYSPSKLKAIYYV